jgi:hypothetical protein
MSPKMALADMPVALSDVRFEGKAEISVTYLDEGRRVVSGVISALSEIAPFAPILGPEIGGP